MIAKKTSVLVLGVVLLAMMIGLTFFFREQQRNAGGPPGASATAAAAPARNFVILKPGEDLASIVRKAAGVVPSPAQLAWQAREFIAFAHFGMNTFTDREWGLGTEDPQLFNPTAFDARQWVRVFKAAGMTALILTAKHHDGFCLWPSSLTAHGVKSSPWRAGKGDVVGDVATACREAGLAFGVYLSPWDRHEPSFGDSPRYNEFFRGQLRELLTNYGPVAEVWFDGANGEGPNGKKQVYDWASFYKVVRELQPQAVIFGMGPDIRWVGTESGYGRETEWSVVPADIRDPAAVAASSQPHPTDGAFLPKDLTEDDLGSREKIKKAKALIWYPAETDVSIRPGWFYHAREDDQVKPPETLLDIYFTSAGRNSVLLLNVPPDRRGLIHDADARSLRGLRRVLGATFGTNLAAGAAVRASSEAPGRPAAAILDGDRATAWAAAENAETAWIEFAWDKPRTFDCVSLSEDISTGQRIEEFALESWTGGAWEGFAGGTTIGAKRLLRFPERTAQKVRLVFVHSRTSPTLASFGLHRLTR